MPPDLRDAFDAVARSLADHAGALQALQDAARLHHRPLGSAFDAVIETLGEHAAATNPFLLASVGLGRSRSSFVDHVNLIPPDLFAASNLGDSFQERRRARSFLRPL